MARATRRATSTAAAACLDQLLAELPFPIRGLQVDGGSECMAAFETACPAKDRPLLVLPPKSARRNGAVARADGSWRHESYAVHDRPDTLAEPNPLIESYQHPYHHHRPQGALQALTPAQYPARHHGLELPPSQIS